MYCLNYWNFSYTCFFQGVKHLTVSFPAEIKTTFISLKIEGLYFKQKLSKALFKMSLTSAGDVTEGGGGGNIKK